MDLRVLLAVARSFRRQLNIVYSKIEYLVLLKPPLRVKYCLLFDSSTTQEKCPLYSLINFFFSTGSKLFSFALDTKIGRLMSTLVWFLFLRLLMFLLLLPHIFFVSNFCMCVFILSFSHHDCVILSITV